MKSDIHPTFYPETKVVCACGNAWTTGSTRKELRVDICSKCHPFISGEQQRLVDIEGQVDRFYKKLQARQTYVEDKKAREDARLSPNRPALELELGKRATDALTKAGLATVGLILARLGEGDSAILAVEGFGQKALIDLKKKLRAFGYEIPEAGAA
ncbi:MAG: 50S ribosomal protein L31 [Chloroflexi bacterium]|nr:50S ribosomal protein L31 [Chloroflexota bacterium]